MDLFKLSRAGKRSVASPTSPKTLAPFLTRLNADIRLQIYSEILSSREQTLHICTDKRRGRRLRHLPCETPNDCDRGDKFTWGTGRWKSYHMNCSTTHNKIQQINERKWFAGKARERAPVLVKADMLSLLLSCKAMYEKG
jgi:hypothetical protein